MCTYVMTPTKLGRSCCTSWTLVALLRVGGWVWWCTTPLVKWCCPRPFKERTTCSLRVATQRGEWAGPPSLSALRCKKQQLSPWNHTVFTVIYGYEMMRHHGIYDGNKENKQLHSSARRCAGEQKVETFWNSASPVHPTAVTVHQFTKVVLGTINIKRLVNIRHIMNNKATSLKQNKINKYWQQTRSSIQAELKQPVTNCIEGIIKYLLIKWMTRIFLAS